VGNAEGVIFRSVKGKDHYIGFIHYWVLQEAKEVEIDVVKVIHNIIFVLYTIQ
jgi:hypothetical protein